MIYATCQNRHILKLEGSEVAGPLQIELRSEPGISGSYSGRVFYDLNSGMTGYDCNTHHRVIGNSGSVMSRLSHETIGGNMYISDISNFSEFKTFGNWTITAPKKTVSLNQINVTNPPPSTMNILVGNYQATAGASQPATSIIYPQFYTPLDWVYMIMQDEPTPGAYTYPAGTNVNLFHHASASPSNTATITKTSTYTNTVANRLVTATYNTKWSFDIEVYYITSPLTPAKIVDTLADSMGLPHSTSSSLPGNSVSSTLAGWEYMRSLKYKNGMIYGNPATGLTLPYSARIYGALVFRTFTEYKHEGIVSFHADGNPFENYNIPGTNVSYTGSLDLATKYTLTPTSNIDPIDKWVSQPSY